MARNLRAFHVFLKKAPLKSMPTRPHIIFIMTDQQRADTIGAWGQPHMRTPAMDFLASKGTSFRHAFAPGATCVPSRASIFTGVYPQQTGAYTFLPWGHQPNWVQDLAAGGYYCASIGKMHFLPIYTTGGYHERIVVENPADRPYVNERDDDDWGYHLKAHGRTRPLDRYKDDPDWLKKFQGITWDMPEELHPDVFVGEKSVEWIRAHPAGEQPVFLQIGFTGPHEPYDPLERHLEPYRNADVPLPVFAEGELDRKPPQHRTHGENFANAKGGAQIQLKEATAEDFRRMRRHYYAKISTVDEQIGRVLEALRVQGYLDNALVILCSDHGDMLGDHRLPYKWLMYDSAVQVPLIVWDTRMKGQRPQSDELASLIDIGPTVLRAAGINPPTYYQGRSLLGTLDPAQSDAGPEYVFCCDNYQTMVRSRTHKLVHYLHQEQGELYDLVADPHELDNRWSDPALDGVKRELKEALLEWTLDGSYRHAGYKTTQAREYELRDPRRHASLHFSPSIVKLDAKKSPSA